MDLATKTSRKFYKRGKKKNVLKDIKERVIVMTEEKRILNRKI